MSETYERNKEVARLKEDKGVEWKSERQKKRDVWEREGGQTDRQTDSERKNVMREREKWEKKISSKSKEINSYTKKKSPWAKQLSL